MSGPTAGDLPLASETAQGHNLSLELRDMPTINFIDQPSAPPRQTGQLTQSARRGKIQNPKSEIRNLFWCLPFLLAGLCFWQALPSADHSARPIAIAAIKAPAREAEQAIRVGRSDNEPNRKRQTIFCWHHPVFARIAAGVPNIIGK